MRMVSFLLLMYIVPSPRLVHMCMYVCDYSIKKVWMHESMWHGCMRVCGIDACGIDVWKYMTLYVVWVLPMQRQGLTNLKLESVVEVSSILNVHTYIHAVAAGCSIAV